MDRLILPSKERKFFGVDYIKEGSKSIGGGGGNSGGGSGGSSSGGANIPQSFLRNVNNHINDKKKHPGIVKDMVFGLSSPMKIGPQPETEIIFPHKSGIIERIDIVVSSESKFTSNLIIAIEQKTSTNPQLQDYHDLVRANLNIYEYKYSKEVNIPIENNIIRLNLIDGDYEQIKSFQLILVIKDIVKIKY